MKVYFLFFGIICALLSSAIPTPGTDVWYSQYIAILWFVCTFFAFDIFKFNKSLGLFLMYIIFSTVFIAKQDLMSIMCLFPTIFCFYVIKHIAQLEAKDRRNIYKVVFALLIIQIFWGFLQAFNWDPIFKISPTSKICDTVGFSGSKNQYGLFLAAANSAALYLGHPFFIIVTLLAVVLSKTFTAYLALAFSAMFYFIYRWKINANVYLLSIVILAILFLSVVPKGLEAKFSERYNLWKLSVSQVIEGKLAMKMGNMVKIKTCNPLFGYGYGKFMGLSPYTQEKIIIKRNQHRYEHAHNDYVEVLFDMGITGFLLLCFVFYSFINSFIKARKTTLLIAAATGLIAYGICALSIYTVHTAAGGFFLAVYTGLFLGELNGT